MATVDGWNITMIQTTRFEAHKDNEAPLYANTFAEMMERITTLEKEKETNE